MTLPDPNIATDKAKYYTPFATLMVLTVIFNLLSTL